MSGSAASRNSPWNTPEQTHNKQVNQEGCETGGTYLRKWLKTLIMFYFGTGNNFEIAPMRLIFNTPLKVAKIDM